VTPYTVEGRLPKGIGAFGSGGDFIIIVKKGMNSSNTLSGMMDVDYANWHNKK
jgi:hypothetical protein